VSACASVHGSLCGLLFAALLVAGCEGAEPSSQTSGVPMPRATRVPPVSPERPVGTTIAPIVIPTTVGPLEDSGKGVAVDGQGNVYLAGRTMGVLDGATSHGGGDGFVAKWGADGVWLWTQQYGTDGYDLISAIAVAPDGDVLIAGHTSGQYGPDTPAGGTDAFVARLDGDGELRWVKQFGSAGVDFASAVAVSADGLIYVASEEQQDPSRDQFLAALSCFDASGALRWRDQWGGAPGAEPFGIAARGNAIYVVGRSSVRYDAGFWGDAAGGAWSGVGFVRRYDASGQLLWEHTVDAKGSEVHAVAIDDELGAVVVGRTFGALGNAANLGAFDGFAMRLAADGTARGSSQFGTLGWDDAVGVAILSDGDLAVAGNSAGDFDGAADTGYGSFVMRCDALAKPRWVRQAFADTASAMAIGADESVYATGWLFSAAPPAAAAYEADAYLAGFDLDGEHSVQQVLGSAALSDE
jgi:hypothetical protein